MTDRYTVKVEEDQFGDLILPLPESLLEELGWVEGDTLKWIDNGDGTFSLRKKEVDVQD